MKKPKRSASIGTKISQGVLIFLPGFFSSWVISCEQLGQKFARHVSRVPQFEHFKKANLQRYFHTNYNKSTRKKQRKQKPTKGGFKDISIILNTGYLSTATGF